MLRDSRGQFLCGCHQQNMRICRFCDIAFLPRVEAPAADRCPRCAQRGIVESARAEKYYRTLRTWFRAYRLELPEPRVPLELRAEMPRDQEGTALLGFVEKYAFLFGRVVPERIVLQCGLPPEAFMTVLVHELGHVWMAHQGLKLPEFIEEAVCTWLQHAFAHSLQTYEATVQVRNIEQRNDPIYGRGFRVFRDYAAGAGPADLLRLVNQLTQDRQLLRTLTA